MISPSAVGCKRSLLDRVTRGDWTFRVTTVFASAMNVAGRERRGLAPPVSPFLRVHKGRCTCYGWRIREHSRPFRPVWCTGSWRHDRACRLHAFPQASIGDYANSSKAAKSGRSDQSRRRVVRGGLAGQVTDHIASAHLRNPRNPRPDPPDLLQRDVAVLLRRILIPLGVERVQRANQLGARFSRQNHFIDEAA